MPVFPAVASRTRPPGFNSPRFSASRIIHLPARSFTDWPGFMNSALPRMVQPVISEARVSLINGVLPIASTTSLLMVMCLNRRFLPDHSATLEPFPFRWNRNGALDSCFDAFSSREPVSTSLENALVSDRPRQQVVDLAGEPISRKAYPFANTDVRALQPFGGDRRKRQEFFALSGAPVDRIRLHGKPGLSKQADRSRHMICRRQQQPSLAAFRRSNRLGEFGVFLGVARAPL